MYQRFKWTRVAYERNAILKRYEPIQPYILLELARKSEADTFIDIGANIGTYSIFMSSLEGVRSVHAFEPSPQTFRELSENVKLNTTDKIKIYRQALSDSPHEALFGIVGECSGANSIVDGSIHAKQEFVRQDVIECTPLDNLGISTAGRMCIKLDVEGHEDRVLAGAEMTLARNKALLQVERRRDDSAVSEILARCNYHKLFVIGPDWYYTNIEAFTSTDIISAFEGAARTLIESNFDPDTREDRPLKLTLMPGFNLEVSGSGAGFARKVKQRVTHR
jgi:FkbM family methyltransferase